MPIYSHRELTESQTIDCDVCIIGSGAGGGMLAEGLAQAGFDVVMLEAGEHRTQKDFNMDEGVAFARLYQEGGLRATDDLSITILQGECVGGTTTINWTTCFRTPDPILTQWQHRYGLTDLTNENLTPHFEAVEKRLNISEWPKALANANNQIIFRGCEALGWESTALKRNVKGCANSGYCSMGCPVNAKQGMLVTTIPAAVEAGMRLYTNTRADVLVQKNNRIDSISASVWNPDTRRKTGVTMTIRPKITVSACGAINGPALFLRSGINDNNRVGLRTFIHPVVAMGAVFDEPIHGFYGAPQSASTHHFFDRGPTEIGYFIEAAPTHPMLAATAASRFGISAQDFMAKLSHMGFLIAIHDDGIIDGDEGGQVSLRSDGRVSIDYPIRPALARAFQHAHHSLGELALASGAKKVQSLHLDPVSIHQKSDLALLDRKKYGALEHGIFTAHQMGGLAMGSDPKWSVVNPEHRHHRIKNLYVVDGSVFPTSVGVNPSQTIYTLAHRARSIITDALRSS